MKKFLNAFFRYHSCLTFQNKGTYNSDMANIWERIRCISQGLHSSNRIEQEVSHVSTVINLLMKLHQCYGIIRDHSLMPIETCTSLWSLEPLNCVSLFKVNYRQWLTIYYKDCLAWPIKFPEIHKCFFLSINDSNWQYTLSKCWCTFN